MTVRSGGDRGGPAASPPADSPAARSAVTSSTHAPEGAATPTDGHDSHALPIGTRLGEFEVIRHIGDGGFSVVYLAHDHTLERQVALKEYMPAALATRLGRCQVNPRSERHRETFQIGLNSFMNEAKLLAQFDHPALVKVFRFWEANGTAYMAMPFYQGSTLKDTVRAMPVPPDEAWLLGLLGPLTEVLELIHAVQCYHRDIAPDNLILLHDSPVHPLLLDFGAARRVIGDLTQALTVILKPGYAPVEQYAEVPGMRQGPWTDVYALGAVVYWAIMGRTPPPAVGRMMQDTHVPLAACASGAYSARFVEAIDRALIVSPDDRTRSIADFRDALGLGRSATSRQSGTATRAVDPDATVISIAAAPRGARTPSAPPLASGDSDAAPAPLPGDRRRVRRAAAGVLGLGLLTAAAWWAYATFRPLPPTPAPAGIALPNAPAASSAVSVQSFPSTPVTPAPAFEAAPVRGTATPTDKPPTLPAASKLAPDFSNRRSGTRPAARTSGSDSHATECAQIFQRLSLGENRPDLLERASALKCR